MPPDSSPGTGGSVIHFWPRRHKLRVSGKPLPSTLLHARNAIWQRRQSVAVNTNCLEPDSWVPYSALPFTSPTTLAPEWLNLPRLQCPSSYVVGGTKWVNICRACGTAPTNRKAMRMLAIVLSFRRWSSPFATMKPHKHKGRNNRAKRQKGPEPWQ